MKYRKGEHNVHYSQSFDIVVDEFTYDEKNDCLIVTGSVNLQEHLQSGLSTALDKILDKFLDIPSDNVIDSPNIFDATSNNVDLAEFGEVIEKADYYRDLFNLPSDMSYDEVFEQAKSKLSSLVPKQDNEKIEKEVIDNETKTNK